MEQKVIIKKAICAVVLTAVLVGLDQITKMLAVIKLKGQNPFVIIENVFELRYLENRGAAFGMLQGQRTYFIVVTVATLLILGFIYLKKIPSTPRFRFLNGICILFFAAAIGNFIDRVANGYVVDFFYFRLIDFPIFNVADCYLTVCAFLTVLLAFTKYKEDEFTFLSPKRKEISDAADAESDEN